MNSSKRDIAPSAAVGCCVLALIVWAAWLVVVWWATGVLVDWANAHYDLGLTGNVVLVFHLLVFLVLGSFTSAMGRTVSPRSS